MRAVLLRGWQRIAHTSACQRLSRPFARHKAQRMASDCSFFRSSTAFAVCAPFCTANGSGFLLLAVVISFQYGLRAVLLSGWQRIAQRMAADSSFFRSSTPFIVRALFYSPDDSALLILPFVNGCHGLRAVFPNRWQRIARSSARQRLSRWVACRIALWMVADFSYFLSSKAFTTVYAPYFCAHVCGLLIFPLVKGFHGLRAVLLSEWLRIAYSCARQRLSRLLACRFPQWMVVYCWFFRLSIAFTVCALLSSADDSALLVLPLVNSIHGLHTVFLSG